MGNSSVYVRNGNQGEYTKNTHCEKKNTSRIIMRYYNDWRNIHVSNKNIQTIYDDLLFGII